ncbi:hypothetical protein BB560_003477 [Smittium megazygosporum]|uniref:Cytochrome P450 n=1 Tax=Smittium megazygosporum TaxID=133381 RepID=A0A2T9ZBV1_9FUNG|nr:hypothetical protein BB560_006131 [Smittium megazygosporum]PVV02079.1 hypothetical protein BB560_003477 [Smittium megazygosporum]
MRLQMNPLPASVKNYELSSDSNLLEYLSEFKKTGYVSKFIGSKSDLNLGKPHLKLFSGLPEAALSSIRVKKKAFYKDWSNKAYFEAVKLNSIIRYFVYSNASNSLLEIEYVIHQNINKNSDLFLQNKYVFVENIFDYFHDILIDIAIRQCYGGAVKSDPEFCKAVELLLKQPISFGEKYISHLLKFSFVKTKTNYNQGREYLRDFVIKGKFQELNQSSFDEYEKLSISDDIFYTSLPNYLYLSVINIGNQLANFFIDISLNPAVFKKLESEQRMIIEKYGHSITIRRLGKMIYLDAAISETMRLGTNTISMKQSLCDIYLSNGILLPKGFFTKFNTVTYNRSSDIFLNHPHDYIPERHFKIGTKLNEISKTNLVWGLECPCPYRKYISIFMKFFISTVIRKYEVSQGDENSEVEHGGYFFDFFVQHAKKSLYLRQREI